MSDDAFVPLSPTARLTILIGELVDDRTINAGVLESLIHDLDVAPPESETRTSVAVRTDVNDALRRYLKSPGLTNEQAKRFLRSMLERIEPTISVVCSAAPGEVFGERPTPLESMVAGCFRAWPPPLPPYSRLPTTIAQWFSDWPMRPQQVPRQLELPVAVAEWFSDWPAPPRQVPREDIRCKVRKIIDPQSRP
jgi:hypothetical protein